MRKTEIEPAALAALLVGAALAWCQQPAPPALTDKDAPKDQPAKSKLEELLEKALRDNPDVRLAEAKAAEAEAELNRARLQVVQRVAAAYQAVAAQKATVESAEAELGAVKSANAAGAAPEATLRAAEQKLIDAKARLADLETELAYVVGDPPAGMDAKLAAWMLGKVVHQPSGRTDAEMMRGMWLDLYGRLPTPDELASGAPPKPSVEGATADRIRAALDKPFTYECKDKPVGDVLRDMNKAFQEANSGLLIKDAASTSLPVEGEPALSVHFDHMPFGAALEWVEDSMPSFEPGTGYRFVVRDYGLVMAPQSELPPEAPLLHDFWKGSNPGDKMPPPAAKDESSNPPAKHVEGVIQAVDAAGLVRLNIGSDDGVAKGNTLEVYLLIHGVPDQTKYMGRIRVIETTAHESVAKPVGQMAGLVQTGLHVFSRSVGD